ncbi:MAG: hypothetical protein QY331_00155 [Melioribacteraceae bacterium]|nr:MAG: hypothetical protein QY331_00155 [Melioribacteraceae bacterium]
MKTIIQTILLLTFVSTMLFSQVIVPEPGAPDIYRVWGNEKLSEKEEQEYLSKITNAQLKQELQQIKKLDEKRYYSILRRTSYFSLPSIYSIEGSGVSIVGEQHGSDNLRKRITELEMYSEVLSTKYLHADQSDKQKLSSQLKTTLSEAFDLRESQRKEEVEKLENKLAELKESIHIRKQNKEQIVEERFRTLTGKGKYLKWD